ncbi:MAG: archaetidylserine decarboxylase [Pseudobdellovibrionaceae bacterium]|jgi:phosphatidylserine decarboxylase
MSAITKVLPRKILSRLVGVIVHLPFPWPITQILIFVFAQYYKINLNEADDEGVGFKSLGDFFVRKLKSSARPLGTSDFLHCADSKITQQGDLLDGHLIQAKGKTYRVDHLFDDPRAYETYKNGYFLTYYLCPTDYHRVHAPITGIIDVMKYLPGDLWPVNEWSTHNVPNIFCLNERVIVNMKNDHGSVSLVFVGATNVGFIEMAFDGRLQGNHGQVPREFQYSPTVKINKGEELGRFRMGSTVVLLMDMAMKKYLLSQAGVNETELSKHIHFANSQTGEVKVRENFLKT